MKHIKTVQSETPDIKDYEQVIQEQKKRISELRDEKRELEKTISEYEKQREMISGAIINAEVTAQNMIENAKRTAVKMLSDANKRVEREEERVISYRDRLYELDEICEKILLDIRSGLSGEKKPLGIVMGGKK